MRSIGKFFNKAGYGYERIRGRLLSVMDLRCFALGILSDSLLIESWLMISIFINVLILILSISKNIDKKYYYCKHSFIDSLQKQLEYTCLLRNRFLDLSYSPLYFHCFLHVLNFDFYILFCDSRTLAFGYFYLWILVPF